MPTRKHRRQQPLALQLAEMAVAVPQVVGHRVTRMALAGARPSARDRREFRLMGVEKAAAFTESWLAMALHAAAAQQQLALGLLWGGAVWPGAWQGLHSQWAQATQAVLRQGLAPVHRRAVANAKRLRTTRLTK